MPSAIEIAAGVREGSLDAVAVTSEALERLAAHNPDIHAYLDADQERALNRAREVAEQVGRGEDPGRLAGVPISIKDNIAEEGATLTAGSRILEGYRAPSASRRSTTWLV